VPTAACECHGLRQRGAGGTADASSAPATIARKRPWPRRAIISR
jgi:hypothetical protein